MHEELKELFTHIDPAIDPNLKIAYCLAVAIARGLLEESGQIPSTAGMARIFGVNPMTAHKALVALRAEGIVTRTPGANYTVAPGAKDICLKRGEEEIRHELALLYRKSCDYLLPRNEIVKWLKSLT